MYVAKMGTRYPDFHGEGYYNFVMSNDEGELADKIEANSHDFRLIKMEELKGLDTIEDVMAKYPTKKALNEGVFDV